MHDIPEDLYKQGAQERRQKRRNWLLTQWHQKRREFLNRRIPATNTITLNQKNIYIFPSYAGLGFIFVLILLLLVAINFENNSVYALTFLVSGILTVSILHTFFNLAGLNLQGFSAKPTFSGREAEFKVLMSSSSGDHLGIVLSWQAHSQVVDIEKNRQQKLVLPFRTGPRGYCVPGRLKIETSYPLGLIRAWTWVDLDMSSIVYPFPDEETVTDKEKSKNNDEGTQYVMGNTDFYGLRSYVHGDSVKSIAWKNYAKRDVLTTKEFVDSVDEQFWLDWDSVTGDVEQRLQKLTHLVIQAELSGQEYGLILPNSHLPNNSIQPDKGEHHLHQILYALAIYQLPSKINMKVENAPGSSQENTLSATESIQGKV